MRQNLPDAAIQEVIGPEGEALVVSIWLFDGSEFAARVRRELEPLIEPRFKRVIRLGSAGAWREITDPLFTAGFQLTLQPLTLLDQIPGLCFWVGENSETSLAGISEGITAFDKAHPGACQHLVIALGTGLQLSRALKLQLRGKGEFLLVSSEGAIQRPVGLVAQAIAVYASSVWQRYWQNPEKNLAKAMWRPLGEGVLTLGLSAARVDAEGHAKRWQEKLCLDLWHRWAKPQTPQASARPATKSLVELIESLLPEWYLAFAAESTLPKLSIESPEETALIVYRSPSGKLGEGRWRSNWICQWMVKLRSHADFLGFIALANCRRFLGRQSRGLFSLLAEPLGSFIQPPSEPEGLFKILRARLAVCLDYAHGLQQLRLGDGAQPGTTFEEDWQRAARRVSDIPHIMGALARCGLIAIGLAWLVIGPWVWSGGGNPWQDQLARPVVFSSAIVLGICIIGIFIHYSYACFAAVSAIERASRNVEVRHLSGVASLAIERVRGAANELEKKLAAMTEDLGELEELARNQPRPMPQDPGTVGPDNLTLGAVDRLLNPEFDRMRAKVHENVCRRLAARPGEHFLQIDSPTWRKLLSDEAASVAREELSRLRYEDCVAVETDAEPRLTRSFSNLVKEASIPALPDVPADPSANHILFGRRELWESHRGRNDRVDFYELSCRDLLLISVHAVET